MRTLIIVALLAVSAQAIKIQWPSVARCPDGTPSRDSNKCDNNGQGPWPLDPSFAQGEYRPVTKCVEGSYSNPVTCSYEDNSAKNQAYLKPAYIGDLTPQKVVVQDLKAIRV